MQEFGEANSLPMSSALVSSAIAKRPSGVIAKNKTQKLVGIDILRGVAAIGVAWFHSRTDLWVGFREIQADPDSYSLAVRALSFVSLPVSQLGALVMLFFVLSGFCIHLPLANSDRPLNGRSYAIRRFFRIYPAYLAAIALSACFALFLSRFDSFAQINSDLYVASIAMTQNWLFDGGQIAMNPSLWSIPVEVELYVLYPLLLMVHRTWPGKPTFLFVLLLTIAGVSMHLTGLGNASGSFFKYTIIWCAGAWLAERYREETLPRWRSWYAWVGLLLTMMTMLAGLLGVAVFYLHYGWGLVSFILLWGILSSSESQVTLAKFPRLNGMLTGVGTISYSVYLIHYPLFRLAGALWVNHYGSKPETFLVPTVAMICVIPFAWVFYRLFELPFIALGRRLATRYSLAPGVK